MGYANITEEVIANVAKHINARSNKDHHIPVIGISDNAETPQIFEIMPFNEIDNSDINFFAVDGSYNSQSFYNGVSIGIYGAGYLCYKRGVQQRVNDFDDPVIKGRSCYPNNILITCEDDLFNIFDELLSMPLVCSLVDFFKDEPENIFAYSKEALTQNLSSLLSFAQEILEWAMIYEIANLDFVKSGDFILKDGALRSLNIKQNYLVKLGEFIKNKELIIVGVTKNSPAKMELSYTFKQIDDYLQDKLKYEYPFTINDPKRQKLCCWFEISENVLAQAYKQKGTSNMYAKKDITGGRGFGIFHVARLDYVEKLQNYDWMVIDINIFDSIPGIKETNLTRDIGKLNTIFKELTRLTQEHYILGYPYPLVDVHHFITLKNNFNEEIIKRVKLALYESQRIDHVDIENMFLNIHDRF